MGPPKGQANGESCYGVAPDPGAPLRDRNSTALSGQGVAGPGPCAQMHCVALVPHDTIEFRLLLNQSFFVFWSRKQRAGYESSFMFPVWVKSRLSSLAIVSHSQDASGLLVPHDPVVFT